MHKSEKALFEEPYEGQLFFQWSFTLLDWSLHLLGWFLTLSWSEISTTVFKEPLWGTTGNIKCGVFHSFTFREWGHHCWSANLGKSVLGSTVYFAQSFGQNLLVPCWAVNRSHHCLMRPMLKAEPLTAQQGGLVQGMPARHRPPWLQHCIPSHWYLTWAFCARQI